MRNSTVVVCIVLFLGQFNLQGQTGLVNKVIAKVGGELVLLSDLEEQVAYLKDQGQEIGERERCEILEGILAQKLLVNQAKLDSLVVMEEQVNAEIDGRIERILQMMNNDMGQFEAYYGKTVNEVRSEMAREMKNQMLAEQMRNQVMSTASATPSEVIAFYESMPKDSVPYYNSEVEIQELVIKPEVTTEEKMQTEDKLNELREKILNDSASFTQMARVYSDDPGSARNGGDLGMMKRGSLVPEYEAAAYNLRPGEISEVVESEYGFHIIKLLERRGNNIHTQHILSKPELDEDDFQRTRDELLKIKSLIENDSLSFQQAVRLHGYSGVQSYNNGGRVVNNQSGDNYFEVGDLDPDVYFALDTLEVGEITQPLEYRTRGGETLYKIVKLMSRTDPHKASLQSDYAKIQQMASQNKKSETLMDWMIKKRKSTFIEVSEGFSDCPNLESWLSTTRSSAQSSP
ncbi:MAG: peptidylprolyl isomerase [Bacteroidetes bacterium]|jgi:peptidyl-prolyl cis-trans isomerase SurA|nr:peptidylprolyl isomerase [Bacteroidota bacterium]